MSRITGGIFSRPSGSTGGLVFGAARSRTGKVVTIREKVNPSNPNTPAQQTQRTKFSDVLNIVRTLGAAIYQTDWNRSIGQLPGFQSMMSIFLNQMTSLFDLELTLPINLGILAELENLAVTPDGLGGIDVSYDAGIGSNGTTLDIVHAFAIAKTAVTRDLVNGIGIAPLDDRSAGQVSIAGMVVGQVYELYVYVVGVGTAQGLISIASPFEVTVT